MDGRGGNLSQAELLQFVRQAGVRVLERKIETIFRKVRHVVPYRMPLQPSTSTFNVQSVQVALKVVKDPNPPSSIEVRSWPCASAI